MEYNQTKISLKGVQETLLMPLWWRAEETKNDSPTLIDDKAVQLVNGIDYDFSKFENKIPMVSRYSWIARSIFFDNKIIEFLNSHSDEATIISIGCGLDTTYERVHRERETWYELDFPDVINIRKQVLDETSNRRFLPYSALSNDWYSQIIDKSNVFIFIAGVIYYFTKNEIKQLFQSFREHFGNCSIALDYCSGKGVKIANKKVIKNGKMDNNAILKWGTNNIRKIEEWGIGITVDENMKMFKEYKNEFSLTEKIGMVVSDTLSIMSLAKISIQKAK